MDLRVINTDSQEGSSPCAFGVGKPADSLRVGYAAGAVLLTQTNEEFMVASRCLWWPTSWLVRWDTA